MRKIKEGKKGEASRYITRAKSIRKLQLSLKEFRKLCILKGVYPREPPKKLKKTNRTYYHLKDINFLGLDPLIESFRQQKIYRRKLTKAKAKGEIGSIKYLSKHKPTISLNHLVRERYPEFLDAIRDLDDPLSLLALFSNFPARKEYGLTAKKLEAARQQVRYFELYVIKSRALKKAFVSLKGFYYQAQIMGQNITYTCPFKYPPSMPCDVDYRVMVTFLDFYLVLMKFVNYKLYSSIGLVYPPLENDSSTYSGYEFTSILEEDEKYKIDNDFNVYNTSLFDGLCFFLSAEVPTYSLEYIILAQGGKVELNENHAKVTHVITDKQSVEKQSTKEYVQPQWVYDCINFAKILPVNEYNVGKVLPPHVSPFVDENDTERYIPEREKELRGLKKIIAEENNEINDDYDVVHEKKKELKNKKINKKEMTVIAKSIMSNKDRKLLRNIEQGQKKKRDEVENLAKKAENKK